MAASGEVIDQVGLIRDVFLYAHRFRGATFVFHIDYDVINADFFPLTVRDLVLLHQVGIRVILVPGARRRIDQVLEQYGIACEQVEGVRISPPEAMPFIKMAAFDVANRLMTQLSGHETNAVIGNWVRARSMGVVNGLDYGDSGVVERVNIVLLRRTLDEGLIPIFPCIGWSAAGHPYNISSLELARRIAVELGSEKLFFVAGTGAVSVSDLNPEVVASSRMPADVVAADGRISRLDLAQTSELLASGALAPAAPHRHLLEIADDACRHGVSRVHIVDGRIEGVILREIFSSLGSGTMVYANEYENIRPMSADDVAEVLRLMQPLVERNILLGRTEADLREATSDYVVYETDGTVHGCAALHNRGAGTAEIAAVAVDERFAQLSIGRRLVAYLLDRARAQGVRRVIALTTATSDWFESLGFVQGSVTDLPEERRRRYDPSRNSRIYVLPLR